MFFQNTHLLFIGRFAERFGHRDVGHGFSTRRGGVSPYPYDSLNLGFKTKDLAVNVAENRGRFFRALECDPEDAVIPEQVHGRNVVYAKSPGQIPATDGLVTDIPGLVLIVQVADCVPIFLVDDSHRAIGLLHAGWRGTASGIVSSGIRSMVDSFSTSVDHLWAFLGPSIGPCCYEVGKDVFDHFPENILPGNKLDLWGAIRDRLRDEGVEDEHMIMSNICTSCHPGWFFSHRRSGGHTGRMMAALWLR